MTTDTLARDIEEVRNFLEDAIGTGVTFHYDNPLIKAINALSRISDTISQLQGHNEVLRLKLAEKMATDGVLDHKDDEIARLKTLLQEWQKIADERANILASIWNPNGKYVMVPKDPTEEMLIAGFNHYRLDTHLGRAKALNDYRAMIQAATQEGGRGESTVD